MRLTKQEISVSILVSIAVLVSCIKPPNALGSCVPYQVQSSETPLCPWTTYICHDYNMEPDYYFNRTCLQPTKYRCGNGTIECQPVSTWQHFRQKSDGNMVLIPLTTGCTAYQSSGIY